MAACMKLGSKAEGFMRRGQAWFCTTGLPSDVVVVVEEMSFHLHKFPLISKSAKLATLVAEASASKQAKRLELGAAGNSSSVNESSDHEQEIEQAFDYDEQDEAEDGDEEEEEGRRSCTIHLPDIPGGTESFELAAKFCYGVKLELTASNIVPLRCAAEYLQMTEELGEGNLIVKAEGFLNQVILRSWKDSVRALQSCERVIDYAESLSIVKRCLDSISSKACTDPSLFGWPLMDHHLTMQSPGGSVMWNGISTGARPRNARSDWWYDDVSSLSFNMFERLVVAMEMRGLKPAIISGAVMSYGKRYLPGLNRRRGGEGGGGGGGSAGGGGGSSRFTSSTSLTEMDQRSLLEKIEKLLPKGPVVPVRFLFGLLRLAMLLGASAECKARLEARIGLQLDQAGLDDLLMPNYSYTVETLYDIDVVQRIVEHFLSNERSGGGGGGGGGGGSSSVNTLGNAISSSYDQEGSPTGAATPLMHVAKLMDTYLAEVAPDVNLKMSKFQDLAEALPEFSRLVDDGLYRAIDIYLKAHHWLTEADREKLCRTMDCQKLSLEACTHAAQNERLPLRVVVQVLFFEQLQLRTAIAGCFLVNENMDSSSRPPAAVAASASRPPLHPGSSSAAAAAAGGYGGVSLDQIPMNPVVRGEGWANVLRENQVMKVDMDKMRSRVIELEKECTNMRYEIEKLGSKGKNTSGSSYASFSLARKLGCKTKPQVLKPQDVMKQKEGLNPNTLAAALERQQQQVQQQQSYLEEEGGLKKAVRKQQHHHHHKRSLSLA